MYVHTAVLLFYYVFKLSVGTFVVRWLIEDEVVFDFVGLAGHCYDREKEVCVFDLVGMGVEFRSKFHLIQLFARDCC